MKETYKSMQNKDFLYFLCESEFKYVNSNKSFDDKMKEFFVCYNLVSNFEDYWIENVQHFYKMKI